MASPIQSTKSPLEPRYQPSDVLIARHHEARPLPIRYVDMHTTGEPTRIVYQGYPDITGDLLDQRAQAKSKFDRIRTQLMFEPRGHRDMYGAILRKSSELVDTGAAHIAVLFMHNEGYSTMCGHATIALGRFLVDIQDESVFPRRKSIVVNEDSKIAVVQLHAPCGLVEIRVPLLPDLKTSDPSLPVSFTSVPSFATGIGLELKIPENLSWPFMNKDKCVRIDLAYGGAFYGFITSSELGFASKILDADIQELSYATKRVRQAIVESHLLSALIQHPNSKDLGFCYGVVVIEDSSCIDSYSNDAGVNLCFFADQQIDRSPTGSAVSARAALAFAKGDLRVGQSCLYQSIVSAKHDGQGAFRATVAKQQEMKFDNGKTLPAINVDVEGQAFYIASGELIVEEEDVIGQVGFLLTEGKG